MNMKYFKERYTVFQYIRNPEIKLQLFLSALIGGIGAAFCMGYVPKAALAFFLMWALMALLHFGSSYYRYWRIAGISSEIDRILHMEEIVLLHHMDEGELCILENEINKVLCRLREQNQKLKRDKTYLADSLTDLSHQLRTPLTSMNLIVSMLEEEDLLPEKRTEYIRKLQSLQTKVQWLIDVLLKISKLDADAVIFEMQSCNISRLVCEAASPIEIPMELKGQTLEQKTDREATFFGDWKWTVEAVENILKNCMEHTPAGGVISVSGEENALYSEIVIEDNGAGVTKEDLPHIFERFYKGKNSETDSVGIGLALANMIVTKQNGVLKAENRKQGGARFSIRFYKGTL